MAYTPAESQHQLEIMFDKGYRFRLTPTDNSFAQLFVKDTANVASTMQSYPDNTFHIEKLEKVENIFQLTKF